MELKIQIKQAGKREQKIQTAKLRLLAKPENVEELLRYAVSATYHEDTWNFLIVESTGAYYLLEVGSNSQIEDILQAGEITDQEHLFAYEITEDAYAALEGIFLKP